MNQNRCQFDISIKREILPYSKAIMQSRTYTTRMFAIIHWLNPTHPLNIQPINWLYQLTKVFTKVPIIPRICLCRTCPHHRCRQPKACDRADRIESANTSVPTDGLSCELQSPMTRGAHTIERIQIKYYNDDFVRSVTGFENNNCGFQKINRWEQYL